MIISHKHKFIFLKTNKTAGTSIEIALSKFCGANDIITPITPEDEEVREKLGYTAPQNYFLPLSSYGFSDIAKWAIKGKKKQFYNHITAQEIKALVDEDVWNTYYKFCIERNPWDRCISQYYWKYRAGSKSTISEFVNSNEPLVLKKKGYDLYTINGNLAVDKVCKFENLADELKEVCNKVGITEKLELPKAKSKFRKDKRHYKDVLSDADRDRVASLFRDEINLMGYEW